jgi:hypothetical protein
MTNEEMRETIEFIIKQQAQLTTRVDTLVELQASAETRSRRLEESFVVLVELSKVTDERLDDTDRRLNTLTVRLDTLTERMVALAEAQTRTDLRMEELIGAQAHTDGRLNALIDIVERYIARGGNGTR